jgi:hypothetical protein
MSGAAAAETGVSPAFGSTWVDDPLVLGTIQVAEHKPDFSELDYIDDADEVANLSDNGILMRTNRDETTPHNPVQVDPTKVVDSEYTDFPRGITYDDDNDSSTDEVAVEWHDPTHWSTSDATNGSISLSEDGDAMRVSTSSVASGETVTATLDLSTVGSEDGTISDGMSRKFVQGAMEIDSLPSGVLVEVAVRDSAGTEVVATADPSGDATTEKVLAASTGKKVGQARVGELESQQSKTLDDIQVVEIRVSETDADILLKGFNVENPSEWVYGTQEYRNSDGDVDTQDVTEPSGTVGIIGLDTLPSTWDNATLKDVVYDVELRASEVPSEQIHARTDDAPESLERGKTLEFVVECEWPTAYALETVSASDLMTEVSLGSSRYLRFDYAKNATDIDPDSDPWSTIEDTISWTDATGSLGSVGSDSTLATGLNADNRDAVRVKVNLSETELTSALGGGSGAAVSSGGSGDSGGDGIGLFTVGLGSILGIGALFRRKIMSVFA